VQVLLMTDMEGISRITAYRECWPTFHEYWQTGRHKYTADVAETANGLLDGGATSVVIRDTHGKGRWPNLFVERLPDGVRLWNRQDRNTDFDAMFQTGMHARCGTADGFISHTHVPELRIRVNGDLITESHDDAWTVGAPVLGITGDSTLANELDGSLADTPFLGVQQSVSRVLTSPVHANETDSLSAIREFASRCALDMHERSVPRPPERFVVEISLPADLADLVHGGTTFSRRSPSVVGVEGKDWAADARPAIEACTLAALRPWMEARGTLEFRTWEQVESQDPETLTRFRRYIINWMETNYPAWED
jgi:D-amino peptidase